MNDKRSVSSPGSGCFIVLVFLALLAVLIIGTVAFLGLCVVILKEQWDRIRSSEVTAWRPSARQFAFGLIALSTLFVVVWIAYGLISGDWETWVADDTSVVP